jgi:hypothetical protein
MWIVTVDGFFSVTAYDERIGGARRDAAQLLVVRARVREDLERIAAWVGDETLETPHADYPFRVICDRASWAAYLAGATEEISYTNFKDRVAEALGWERHDVLMDVWVALRQLQRAG